VTKATTVCTKAALVFNAERPKEAVTMTREFSQRRPMQNNNVSSLIM